MSVFEYLDYREFLRDFYREQKHRHFYFSFRFLSQKTGIDPAHIARVFQCKRHLSEKSVASFVSLCKLTLEEKRYFEQLFSFNMAKTDRLASQAFEGLLSLTGVKSKTIVPEQYGFYTRWYYTAVRALIAMRRFTARDCTKIASMLNPAITARQAKEAVSLLFKLGLINKDKKGFLRVTEVHITTGEKWRSLAVRAFQEETLRLAHESLDRHAKEIRDISTVTIGIKRNKMDEIRQRISEFRKSIIHLAEEDQSPDDVYQLNVQLFPLTDTLEERRSQ